MGNMGWNQQGDLVWLCEWVCRVNWGPRGCDLPLLGAAVTASDGGSVAASLPPDWSDWEATLTAVKITWVMSLAGSCLWL